MTEPKPQRRNVEADSRSRDPFKDATYWRIRALKAEKQVAQLRDGNEYTLVRELRAQMDAYDDLAKKWEGNAKYLHHSKFCHVKTKASVRTKAIAQREVYEQCVAELRRIKAAAGSAEPSAASVKK